MTKKKLFVTAVLLIVAIVVILVASVAIYVRTVKAVRSNQDESIIVTSSIVEAIELDDADRTESEPVAERDVPPVDEGFLFNPVDPNIDGLLDETTQSKDVMEVSFDNLTIAPGMKVSEIIDISDWYTLRENDVLQPDDAGYLILNNDFWTSADIQLNDEETAHNGEIILWAHNYSDEPALMRDCVIYKYKINYRGCSKIYTEKPQLSYLSKYMLGYKGSYPECDYVEQAVDDDGAYTRHMFGNVNDCQVILDKSDGEGLFAITVSYNEYYGPDFGRKGGSENG